MKRCGVRSQALGEGIQLRHLHLPCVWSESERKGKEDVGWGVYTFPLAQLLSQLCDSMCADLCVHTCGVNVLL